MATVTSCSSTDCKSYDEDTGNCKRDEISISDNYDCNCFEEIKDDEDSEEQFTINLIKPKQKEKQNEFIYRPSN